MSEKQTVTLAAPVDMCAKSLLVTIAFFLVGLTAQIVLITQIGPLVGSPALDAETMLAGQ